MGPIETEIKLRMTAGAEAALELLARHGYLVRTPRILQVDQVFDLVDGALRQSRRLLRVRYSGGTAVLTYKGPPFGGPHKSREELEAAVEPPHALASILERLGYVPVFRYEKYRTTFSQNSNIFEPAVVALDETPIGVFLELEGPGDWIDRTASTMGFKPDHYITSSYATLYRDYICLHGGEPDMRFKE